MVSVSDLDTSVYVEDCFSVTSTWVPWPATQKSSTRVSPSTRNIQERHRHGGHPVLHRHGGHPLAVLCLVDLVLWKRDVEGLVELGKSSLELAWRHLEDAGFERFVDVGACANVRFHLVVPCRQKCPEGNTRQSTSRRSPRITNGAEASIQAALRQDN